MQVSAPEEESRVLASFEDLGLHVTEEDRERVVHKLLGEQFTMVSR